MIYLEDSFFIEKGCHKKCFVHPDNKNLCVKIPRENCSREVLKELKYYRYLKKKNVKTWVIPKYHGSHPTNLGKGYVFELVCDYDGSISKPVSYYLEHDIEEEKMREAFKELSQNLINKNIITRKLKERNLLYQRTDENSGRIIIVDDIGPTELIPLGMIFPFFGKKKIQRKLLQFKEMILNKYPGYRA